MRSLLILDKTIRQTCMVLYSVTIMLFVTSMTQVAFGGAAPELFYDIDVKLSESCETIEVDLSICYEGSPGNRSTSYLLSNLAKIESIHLIDKSGERLLHWTQSSADTLFIDFPDSNLPAKNVCIRFKYTLPGSEQPSSDIILRRENRWYPILPTSPFRYRLEYESPGSYTVLSSGHKGHEDLVGNTIRGVWLQMYPTFTLPLLFLNESLVSTHEIESRNGITIRYYGHTEIDSTVISILNTCAKSLDFLEEKTLCPYPYRILHVVEIADFPAVQSLPGMLLVGEMLIEYYWYEGLHDWPSHEVAHQWIGNIVLTNSLPVQPGYLFVEESIAEYLRVSFIRYSLGENAADSVFEAYRQSIRSLAGVYSGPSLYELSSIASRDEGKVVYMYGPLVIRELEEHIGNDKLQVLLNTIIDRYRFKPFSYRNLKQTIISVTQDSTAAALIDSYTKGTLDMIQ